MSNIIQTDSGKIEISKDLVRKYLVRGQGNVTDQEVMLFMALCKNQKLNPWINEAYLIKFGTAAATIVVGKEVFTKRAFKNENCDGWKAGITVYNKESKELIDREGTIYIPDIEKLVGGWCEVFFKDKKTSMKGSAMLDEYIAKTKDGKPNTMWATKPATMIRKVAIVQTLRESFPKDFQGCYFEEEMQLTEEKIDEIRVAEAKEILEEKNNKKDKSLADKAKEKINENDMPDFLAGDK